jgi:FkbM family methyltransferase
MMTPISSRKDVLSDVAIALLEAARSGSGLVSELLRPVFADGADSLSPEDLEGFQAQLTGLLHLPQDIALAFVQGALSQGQDAVIRRMRDKQEAVRGLFSAIEERRPLPLLVRSAFGALSEAHERVLRAAVLRGAFTARDASECYYDGDEVTRRLGGANVCETPLCFRTVDFQGMPRSDQFIAGVRFFDVVEVGAGACTFAMLVSNETELRQASHPEEDTIDWLRQTIKPGSVLLDVGANVGLYSLYAAHLVPSVRVVSFEPCPFNFAHLLVNIQLNGISSILPYPFALSNATRLGTFGIGRYAMPGGWSHPGVMPPSDLDRYRIGCQIFKLDDLGDAADAFVSPTHLKIDVDGADVDVLRGAQRTLALPSLRHVLIELTDDRCAEAEAVLMPLGFEARSVPSTGFGNRIYTKRFS